jgi:hypothetical protein
MKQTAGARASTGVSMVKTHEMRLINSDQILTRRGYARTMSEALLIGSRRLIVSGILFRFLSLFPRLDEIPHRCSRHSLGAFRASF